MPKKTKKIIDFVNALDGYGLIVTDDKMLKKRIEDTEHYLAEIVAT